MTDWVGYGTFAVFIVINVLGFYVFGFMGWALILRLIKLRMAAGRQISDFDSKVFESIRKRLLFSTKLFLTGWSIGYFPALISRIFDTVYMAKLTFGHEASTRQFMIGNSAEIIYWVLVAVPSVIGFIYEAYTIRIMKKAGIDVDLQAIFGWFGLINDPKKKS
jgi:hypothetical protein